jgi:hypothetical protein
MINKACFFLFFLVPVLNISYGQSDLSESDVEELIVLGAALEGTYQIQMIDTRALPAVELSIYSIIQEQRSLKNVVYYYLNSNTRIMILSFETIESPNFKSLDRIAYISSENIEHE